MLRLQKGMNALRGSEEHQRGKPKKANEHGPLDALFYIQTSFRVKPTFQYTVRARRAREIDIGRILMLRRIDAVGRSTQM